MLKGNFFSLLRRTNNKKLIKQNHFNLTTSFENLQDTQFLCHEVISQSKLLDTNKSQQNSEEAATGNNAGVTENLYYL